MSVCDINNGTEGFLKLCRVDAGKLTYTSVLTGSEQEMVYSSLMQRHTVWLWSNDIVCRGCSVFFENNKRASSTKDTETKAEQQ